MAFNLSASLKGNLTTAVNSVKTTVNTVSQNISTATGLSTGQINSAFAGTAIGALAGGSRGAAIGALAGGLLGSDGASNLLGQVQNKLQRLVSNAEELTGLISNPLKVVERGIADLAGLTGEEYALTLSQYRELSERSAFTDFIDNGYMTPFAGDDSSASRIPNPLRNHNSFNYTITLGVLSASEYNNPESYRSAGGFKNYIIKSSGGDLGKRYQVFDEKAGGSDHAEYYIEDLELDAVVAPNPNTRVTLGTGLTFKVTEPYSMGNFIQAVVGAAADAGYSSYSTAPFCLRFDFNGWNLDGSTDANFIPRPIFLPIKFVNMEFSVSGQGSEYQVKAVPMSESGLADDINKIKTSVRANGTLVHQVLETNDNSITGAINSHLQGLEDSGSLAPFDRYIICFPKTRTALVDALKSRSITESAFTTSTEEQQAQRTGAGANNPQLRASFNPTIVTIPQSTQTYAILKSFAENTNLMNEIGLSPINEDTNAPGNSSEAPANAVVNPATGLVDTTTTAAQPATVARDYQFNQGQQVTSIIERIVMQSRYAAERATATSNNGLNKWFKIDTQVFIDDGLLTESQMGRKPRVYVYSIVPYEVDEATTMAPNSRPGNTRGLRQSAAKEFNYIYTGKNEDVLNFEIKFNNAFLMTATSNFGSTTGTLNDPSAGTTSSTQTNADSGAAPPPTSDLKTADEPGPSVSLTDRNAESSGTHSNDVRRQIAEMFHDRITNLPVDMVTAEMEIIGDPFFIPQESGNYVAPPSGRPGVTQDGTMTYQQGPVFCVVNFRTPFDYQVRGATMEIPQIVPGFSGLFQVWAVKNIFSRGQFKQQLKLIRRRGQDDPATSGNRNFIQVNNEVAQGRTSTQSDGTVGQSATANTPCLPISGADDIRNLMPAVGKDVADALAGPFKEAEAQLQQLALGFKQAVEGVDFGVAKAPDLSKVIPRIATAAAGGIIGNAVGGRLGAVAGLALGASLPQIPQAGDLANQANAALGQVSSAVNTVANEGVAALTSTANNARSTVTSALNTATTSFNNLGSRIG
jgi:outer membrane lipoprotein SlyB